MLLFTNFPFHNEPFHMNDLKTLEVKCMNQTDLVCLKRFLLHTLRMPKNLCIAKVDNGDSSLSPFCILTAYLTHGPHIRRLRSRARAPTPMVPIHLPTHPRLKRTPHHRDQPQSQVLCGLPVMVEDKPWQGMWRTFREALEGKAWLEEVVLLLWVPLMSLRALTGYNIISGVHTLL
ncbi:hypothetical protein IW261DRAFT_1574819 [Armillaria novae-zelandiae]|uniref:Uncharacterized protein n=1 Tax=Armillaria novae-zelandiae TaxID=153914 RepID=A0AA39TX24_9AGAR|nr:hypothetical protein IW261DRAFT_1574819 [Armillaria novae-zelandiae]